MNEWMNEWTNKWMNECENEWTTARMNDGGVFKIALREEPSHIKIDF